MQLLLTTKSFPKKQKIIIIPTPSMYARVGVGSLFEVLS